MPPAGVAFTDSKAGYCRRVFDRFGLPKPPLLKPHDTEVLPRPKCPKVSFHTVNDISDWRWILFTLNIGLITRWDVAGGPRNVGTLRGIFYWFWCDTAIQMLARQRDLNGSDIYPYKPKESSKWPQKELISLTGQVYSRISVCMSPCTCIWLCLDLMALVLHEAMLCDTKHLISALVLEDDTSKTVCQNKCHSRLFLREKVRKRLVDGRVGTTTVFTCSGKNALFQSYSNWLIVDLQMPSDSPVTASFCVPIACCWL